MNSFNVYGQTETKVGGNTPVWLGTVKPIPVGGIYAGGLVAGQRINAGMPVNFNPEFREVTMAELSSCNAYLYNDLVNDSGNDISDVTCAVVMHHPEGLLIERVYPNITEEQILQLQEQIPGVLLVRG